MHVVVYYLTKHLHDRMKTNAASVCTRSSIIDRFWLNQCNSSSSGGGKQWLWTTQKMILLNSRKTNRNVRLRQLWNLVDCRSNKKDNNKFTREKKILNEKAQYEINFRHYRCLFPYVWICISFLFMRYWKIITRWCISHTLHTTRPDSVSNNQMKRRWGSRRRNNLNS